MSIQADQELTSNREACPNTPRSTVELKRCALTTAALAAQEFVAQSDRLAMYVNGRRKRTCWSGTEY